MCWTLSKLRPSALRRDSEINLLSGENFAEVISPFLKLYSFLSVHLSPPPPHSNKKEEKKIFTDQDSWSVCVPFPRFNFPSRKPQAFLECIPILVGKTWKEWCTSVFFCTQTYTFRANNMQPGWLSVTLSGAVTGAKLPFPPATDITHFWQLIQASLQGTTAV